MKKIILFVLACLMVVSLCACGGEDPADTTGSTQGQNQTTAPTETENNETTVPSTAETTAPVGETTIDDILELVLSYKDQPIEDLIAVIGEPEYSDYAPSCLGEGEDGMLYYDGFIVYTYRENGVETVYDVE